MKSFQHKRGLAGYGTSWHNILQSKPVLVLLGILLLAFAWGVVGFMGKMQTTRENRELAENKLAELQKEKDALSANIAKLKTESGVEASIRDKFGLAKEGEGVIIVVDDKNKPEPPKQDSGGFWNFLKNLFK